MLINPEIAVLLMVQFHDVMMMVINCIHSLRVRFDLALCHGSNDIQFLSFYWSCWRFTVLSGLVAVRLVLADALVSDNCAYFPF